MCSRAVAGLRAPALERSRGEVRLAFARRAGATALADLYQSGCAKARLPRPEPGAACEAVLVNTAGGLTDGDRLTTRVTWGAASTAMVSSQAAERVYRCRAGAARVSATLSAAADALAIWLPQETILFDGGRLRRRTEVDLSPRARMLACESLVFGRHAMGESVRDGAVFDAWRVRCGGRLVFADTLRLDGDIAENLQRPAVAAGAGALASVIYAGQRGDTLVDALRRACGNSDRARVASSWVSCNDLNPVVLVRILAADGQALRHSLVAVLCRAIEWIAEDSPRLRLPRVWLC